MRSRLLCLFAATLLLCTCAAQSDDTSPNDTGEPTTVAEPNPEVTEPTPATTAPVATLAPTAEPVTSPTAMVQTFSLEFDQCERFAMPAMAADLAVAEAAVLIGRTLARPDGFANVSLQALQCNDLITDGESHGPGYFATVFIAIDEPADPPSLPEGSGLTDEPTDYFAPVLFHTDNQSFQQASVAFGVPMTKTESTTFDPAAEGPQTGSAVDNEFANPVAYRWTVENSTWVENPPLHVVHTFVGPSLDDETMIYHGIFSHDAGWSTNPATLTLDPDSGLTELLGESVSGNANGTPVTITMLAFRQPPPPSTNGFVADYPIEYAPGKRLRYLNDDTCSEPLRPAIVSPGGFVTQWEMANRGIAVFDLDDVIRPDSSAFDEEFVGGISLAAADLGIAVRWVRAHAAEYCVAPDAVVVAGYSWGAITSLALAYSTGHVQPSDEIVIDELGNPVVAPSGTAVPVPPALTEYSDVPNAAISHAGFALPDTIDPGEPPALLFHGTNDDTIPFSLAEKTCAAATAVGVVCELVPHENGHGFSGDLHAGSGDDPTIQMTIEFLNREVLAPAGIAQLP
ncbi:MAG: alpha/beta hydrolase [Acidimicrobiia bacterium]|nr:alpha/beta hydrolase [Acidimicrobiia bacterium]